MGDVLLCITVGSIGPRFGLQAHLLEFPCLKYSHSMLRSYIKIGVRNLLKNSLFSVINISGMAISLATFLIITLFVIDEMKFDRHVPDVSEKYFIYTNMYSDDDGSNRKLSMVPPPVAPTLAAEFPEVDYYARFMNFNNSVLFEAGDKKLTETKGGYADPAMLRMLGLRLIEGDMETALTRPGMVAISNTLAKKYFGETPALGQTLQLFNQDFSVDAVYEDPSPYLHLQLNFMISLETFASSNERSRERLKNWGWSQFHSYIKLKPGASGDQLEAKLGEFVERHTSGEDGENYDVHIMPMQDIHLNTYDHQFDISVRGNIQTVYILAATGLFMLVIAILNFVNLSTARAINRVKEVGIRKVMGAFRSQLIRQFVSESIMITMIALVIGVIAAQLVLPALNSFTEKSIPLNVFFSPQTIVVMLVGAVLVGMAAGIYPAFFISAHRPAEILSNKQSGRGGRALMRKGLVLLQFMLSFFLITGSMIVSDQNTFLRTRDMGFDKDNLVVIGMRGGMRTDLEATKAAFLNHGNVISATMGYGLPGQAYAGDGIIDKVANEARGVSMLTVDHDYIRTLGLTVIAGRDFSKETKADERSAFIVSETGAKILGYTDPAEAVGHEVSWQRWDNPDSLKEGKIIGVVKDIHLNSLRDNITPVVLQVYPFAYNTMTLKVRSEDIPSTLAHLESTWKQFNSEWPFEYKFLDDNFDKLYKSEEKLATLFGFFTAFTIFVACLGLFGLVVYSTSQRYKEISIRKVLGASEVGLVMHLGRTYFLPPRCHCLRHRRTCQLLPRAGLASEVRLPHRHHSPAVRQSRFVHSADLPGDSGHSVIERSEGESGEGVERG